MTNLNATVVIDRADIRPCDRCGGTLDMGVMGVVRIESFLLDPQSVRAVAGMEVHFGPGHERLASIMAPPIKATPGMTERKVICFACIVATMEFMAEFKRPKAEVPQ